MAASCANTATVDSRIARRIGPMEVTHAPGASIGHTSSMQEGKNPQRFLPAPSGGCEAARSRAAPSNSSHELDCPHLTSGIKSRITLKKGHPQSAPKQLRASKDWIL